MEEKRFLAEEGLAYFFEKLKGVFSDKKFYLHTIAFNQSISSAEGEPFDTVYLFVITTNSTPAVIDTNNYAVSGDLSLKFELSQILAAYGGYNQGSYKDFHFPVELCVDMEYGGDGYGVGTYIQQAVIPSMTIKCGNYKDASIDEVVFDRTKFIGDTVTEI